MTINDENFTWTKPKPKRTFLLNGVPLPCPVNLQSRRNSSLLIYGCQYYWESGEDAMEVKRTITNILNEARDKP